MSNGDSKSPGDYTRSNGDAKGKAKSSGREQAATGNSMLTRVLDSAHSLARSAIAAPSSSELSHTVAAASASKHGPTASHTGASIREEATAGSSSTSELYGQGSSSIVSSAFRGHSEQHAAAAEAEFSSFLDHVPMLDSAGLSGFEASTPGYAQTIAEETRSRGNPSAGNLSSPPTVQTQEAYDGADVINLLTAPTSVSDLLTEEQVDIYAGRHVLDEPVLWDMTPAQRSEWQQRLTADFPDALLSNVREASGFMIAMPGQSPTLAMGLLPPEDMVARWDEAAERQWIKEWKGVLLRYADEVWGDLLPLVEEAKEEINAVEQGREVVHEAQGHQEEHKALRRLGLVLGHLRQG